MQKYIHRKDAQVGSVKKRRRMDSVRKLPSEYVFDEQGTGEPSDPFRLPLRQAPNQSGCYHCSESNCTCQWMREQLEACYTSLPVKRQTMQHRKRELCAKSVLPEFVSRLVRLAKIKEGEVFYDFGCGNGSVLFQVAALTGARCVGIEINEHNAMLAIEAWKVLRPILEKKVQRVLLVDIICADMCNELRATNYFSGPCVIWAANLLLPRPVNHYLSERLRTAPSGTRIFCFEDLYPHQRSVARIRDPDAFERFDMLDYKWQSCAVEWCDIEGNFYQYTRR